MSKNQEGLRYEDQPSTSVSIHIAAVPDLVFDTIADINLPARFSNEFKGARWLDDAARPAIGARFAGANAHAAIGEWETICTVTEFNRPQSFVYQVGVGAGEVAATWSFRVAAEGDGSELTQSMKMGPGRSGINIAIDAMPEKESRILHRRLNEHRANMEANLAGVKALLER